MVTPRWTACEMRLMSERYGSDGTSAALIRVAEITKSSAMSVAENRSTKTRNATYKSGVKYVTARNFRHD